MATKPIPDGYRTATPYLIIKGAADAIEFYKKAFGATELLRMADPQGRVGHAEIKIGDSVIMLADEHPSMGYRGPRSLGGSSVSILLYLPDVDDVFARAVKAGAKAQRAVANQFYGDQITAFANVLDAAGVPIAIIGSEKTIRIWSASDS